MKNRRTILLFVLLSLLLHLLLSLGLFVNLPQRQAAKEPEVEVTILKQPYQIADIQPPEKEERPEKAKFLGLYDSRVPKEQVAATPPVPPSRKRSESTPEKERTKEKPTKQREGEGLKLAAKSPEKKVMPQAEGDEFLDALPEDFYPDYKIGDRTYLNVLRYPKIGYFVRLKKIFRTTWNPTPSLRSSLFANQISRGQVEVVLGVTIDKSGSLAELFVINSSGLGRYDHEALRTIRESAPFAAPPSDLLDPSSKLRMVWTFTVYL